MTKKRDKKYRPRNAADPNSLFNAINLAKPISLEKRNLLEIGIRTALDAFTKGQAIKYHFDTLASTVDLTMMMANTLFNGDYANEIHPARYAMIRCRERYIRTGKLGLDGEALTAIKMAIEIHSEQLKQITGAELLQFLSTRDHHIRSGNFYKGNPDDKLNA